MSENTENSYKTYPAPPISKTRGVESWKVG